MNKLTVYCLQTSIFFTSNGINRKLDSKFKIFHFTTLQYPKTI